MRAEIYPIENVPFGRLAIMPRPRAGDWLRDEVASWHRAGVTCVVSLLESAEIAELGLEQEAEACRQSGLEFLAFPIPDRGVPRSDDELVGLVESLVSRLRGGRGVAIHCRIGVGRSALVAACVLASLGQPVETAWQSIQKARGLSVPDTPEQREWVANFIKRLNRGPPERQ
jgi:protein-tyrosine phosphatase